MSNTDHDIATLYRAAQKNDNVLHNLPFGLLAKETTNLLLSIALRDGWSERESELRRNAAQDGMLDYDTTDEAALKKYCELTTQVAVIVDEDRPSGPDLRTALLIYPFKDEAGEFMTQRLPLGKIEDLLEKQYEASCNDLRKNPPQALDRNENNKKDKDKPEDFGKRKPPEHRAFYGSDFNLQQERVEKTEASLRSFSKITKRPMRVQILGEVVHDPDLQRYLDKKEFNNNAILCARSHDPLAPPEQDKTLELNRDYRAALLSNAHRLN